MDEQKIINNSLRYVLDLLEPINHYPYHNINHTLDVYSRVGHLTDREGISPEDRTDLLLAALFHDTGFTKQYANNEAIGMVIAQKYLENINWKPERIKKIEGLIRATTLFSEANNVFEGIIQDADLDNLGRKDCFIKTLLVRKELITVTNLPMPKKKWLEITFNLIQNYEYRTLTSQMERTEIKKINAQKLKEKIER